MSQKDSTYYIMTQLWNALWDTRMFDASKKFDYKYEHSSKPSSSDASVGGASGASGASAPQPSVFRRIFGADIRSIALIRVLLGLIVVGDVLDRGQYIFEHYTDYGVMPRYAVLENYWNDYYVCIHLMTGTVFGQKLLFFINGLFGLSLALGFYSRVCAFVCWIFAYSIQVRNPFLLHGGDQYLRLLLFWSIFMPLGECCSLDYAIWYSQDKANPNRNYISEETAAVLGLNRKNNKPIQNTNNNNNNNNNDSNKGLKDAASNGDSKVVEINIEEAKPKRKPSKFRVVAQNIVLNMNAFAFMSQICIMYIASVYHKSGPQWHEQGTSVFYALQLDYFRMPLGDFFLWLIGDASNNVSLWWMTYIVLQWEFWGNFVFLSPFYTDACRLIGAIGFMIMHLGFGLCLRLGTFFWITFSAPLIFFPSSFWDDCVFAVPTGIADKYNRSFTELKSRVSKLDGGSGSQFSIVAKVKALVNRLFDFFPLFHLATPDRVMTIVYDDSLPKLSILVRSIASLFLVPVYQLVPLSKYYKSGEAYLHKGPPLLVVCGGKDYENVEGLIVMCLKSPIIWPIGWLLQKSKHYCFDLIGKATMTRSDSEPTIPNRWKFKVKRNTNNTLVTIKIISTIVFQVIILLLLTLVVMWNMANFDKASVQGAHWIGWTLGIDQAWGMFSPHPPLADWYHVVEAVLEDNSTVDLIPNEGIFKWEPSPLTWKKPVPTYWTYMKSHRWQKVFENLNEDHPWYRLQVGRYFCREYNRRHRGQEFGAPQLKEFVIWVIFNEQKLDGTRGPMEKVDLWHHVC